MKHTTITESRFRGGRDYHRAKCITPDCSWASTWQPGDAAMATNAGRMHEQLRLNDEAGLTAAQVHALRRT